MGLEKGTKNIAIVLLCRSLSMLRHYLIGRNKVIRAALEKIKMSSGIESARLTAAF